MSELMWKKFLDNDFDVTESLSEEDRELLQLKRLSRTRFPLPSPLPERFKDFKFGYLASRPQKSWTDSNCRMIFGRFLAFPVYSSKNGIIVQSSTKYLCFFCPWRGSKSQLLDHLTWKHCSGRGQQQSSCVTCECPLPRNIHDVQEHTQQRCFGLQYERGLFQLMNAINNWINEALNGQLTELNDIFNHFRKHS